MSEEEPYPIRSDLPMPPRRGKGHPMYAADVPLVRAGVELVRINRSSARAAAIAVLKGHDRIGSSVDADVKRLSQKIIDQIK